MDVQASTMTGIDSMIRNQMEMIYATIAGESYDPAKANFGVNVVRNDIAFVAFVDSDAWETLIQDPVCSVRAALSLVMPVDSSTPARLARPRTVLLRRCM